MTYRKHDSIVQTQATSKLAFLENVQMARSFQWKYDPVIYNTSQLRFIKSSCSCLSLCNLGKSRPMFSLGDETTWANKNCLTWICSAGVCQTLKQPDSCSQLIEHTAAQVERAGSYSSVYFRSSSPNKMIASCIQFQTNLLRLWKTGNVRGKCRPSGDYNYITPVHPEWRYTFGLDHWC